MTTILTIVALTTLATTQTKGFMTQTTKVSAPGMDYPAQFIRYERLGDEVVPYLASYENDGRRWWCARIQRLAYNSPLLDNPEAFVPDLHEAISAPSLTTRASLMDAFFVTMAPHEYEPCLPLDEVAWQHHEANLGRFHDSEEFNFLPYEAEVENAESVAA